MPAKSKFGPCLVGRNLFFTGHNNPNVWEAIFHGTTPYNSFAIQDRDGNTSNSACEPSVTSFEGNYHLVYVGMPFGNERIVDNRIWYRVREAGSWGSQTPITPSVSWHETRNAYSTHAPSIHWVHNPHYGEVIMVAYRDIDSRIICAVPHEDGWSFYSLPDNIRTAIGPTLLCGYSCPEVLYRGNNADNAVYWADGGGAYYESLEYHWGAVEKVPHSNTYQTPAGVYAMVGGTHSLIVAFTGHNNNFIWIRVRKSGEWHDLGYVEGVATKERPALSVSEDTIYLGFKPVDSTELCVGALEIDEDVRPDTAGHRWTAL